MTATATATDKTFTLTAAEAALLHFTLSGSILRMRELVRKYPGDLRLAADLDATVALRERIAGA
jgi:hypothetical protein